MEEHPLRRQVVGEMHLRRWPTISVPTLVLMWVVMVEDADRGTELASIEERLGRNADTIDRSNPSHRDGSLGDGLALAWERHSEGTSISLFTTGVSVNAFLDPRSDERLAEAIDWVASLPGKLVRSTCIWTCETEDEGTEIAGRVGFDRTELVSVRLAGRARAWSDFRIHPDGLGRLLVASNGTDPLDFTRQVQRLQELGNYRNRALLGLPLAKENWKSIDEAEARLSTLATRISNSEKRDDELMAELSELSLELLAISTRIGFRMNATAAYARLVQERLAQLDSEAIDGFASLSDFTQRRFLPAVQTCATTVKRERQLSLRAAQLTSLLRTRIETRIENQNANLLRSMERSVSMQLRLQQLVEGLSVVALSYYLIGLVGYVLKGVAHETASIDTDTVLAIITVPVVAVVWLTIRSLKGRMLAETDN